MSAGTGRGYEKEDAPFDDLTRLAARMIDGVNEILEKGNIEAVVMLKCDESHRYGIGSNADEEIPLMLLISLSKVCGGLTEAGRLINMLDAEWIEKKMGPKL